MGKKLINGILLVFILVTNVAISQDLSFTAVTTDTDCDNPNHCVDIQVAGFTDLATFQFGIFYDETTLDHVSSSSSLPTAVIGNPTNGQIGVNWSDNSGQTIADNTTVITVCFSPTGTTGSTTVELGQDPINGFPALAATVGFARVFVLDTDFFLNDATFNITDTVDPTVVCPSDTMVAGAAPVTIEDIAPAMFGDNCMVDMLTYNLAGNTLGNGNDDASGTAFNAGVSTVTYDINDGAGNTGTCSFTISVDDIAVADTFTFIPEISLDCETGNVELCVSVEDADSTNSIGVYWTWDPTQIDYLGRTIIIPGSSVFSDAFVNTGVAGFIWNDGGATGGVSIPNGDSLFCVQYSILTAIDTPIINITDLALVSIEVFAEENGTSVEVPYNVNEETYIVNDNTPPTLSNCPTDTTIILPAGMCNVNYTWTSPNGMDECISNLSIDSTRASGDLFEIGSTTVTYTITDLGGNTASCDFVVTVVDNELPSAICRTDTTVMGIGPIAVNDLNVMASDPCGPVSIAWELTDATVAMGTGDVSGTSFETGTTTVTYSVTDSVGNVAMCSFVVTVDPGPMPDIECPSDTIVGNAGMDCSATVADLAPTIISNPANIDSVHYELSGATTGSGLNDVSGSTFNVGVTNVTYFLTDLLGQRDSCEFMVTVNDTVAPTATCPPLDAFTAPMGQCGIVVNNNLFPATSDNCGVDDISYVFVGATGGMGSNDPTGSFFNVGITVIEYTITDAAGNMTTCNVTVWVNDGETPTITCPTDTIVSLPFGTTFGPINDIDPISIGDNCDVPSVSYAVTGATTLMGTGNLSGQDFNIGANNVTYYVTDTSGNVDSCMFLIPTLLVDPSLIDSITYLVDGATMLSDTADVSGSFFNINISTVTYFVRDIFGNLDSCQFTVTVNDTEDPIWLNCPADTITVYVDNMSCRQVATWSDPIPVDNCTIQTLEPPTAMQGDTFDIGFTTVTYSAMDGSMNVGTCDFVIAVRDTFAPVLNCPSDTVLSTMTGCSMIVNWNFDATDNCGIDSLSSTQNPGDEFPVGVTTVVYTAIDSSGNTTQCSFNITVLDGAAPITTCPAELIIRVDGTIVSDPAGLVTSSTPGMACDSILINFNAPDAADVCDGIVPAVQYAGIQSGENFPIGNTSVSFSATDMNGNIDTCEFDITVLPLGDVNLETTGPNPVCTGEDVTINVITPITGATYTWTGPNGFTGTGESVTISQITEDGAGDYEVTCQAGGNCTSTGMITINVFPLPDITAGSNSPICSNGGTDLTLTAMLNAGSVMVTNWEWTGPNGFSSNDQNPVIADAGSGETGTYTVRATGANGCTQFADVEVVIDDVVTPSISSNCDGAICVGESCLLLGTEFSTTPDAYLWSAEPSGSIGFEANTNMSSVIVTPTVAGVYIINYQVVLAGGCETEVVTFVLTVEAAPDAVGDEFTTTGNVAISGLSLVANDNFNSDIGFFIDAGAQPDHGILVINDDGTFTYVPEEGFLGQDSFSYDLCSNCGVELCDDALVLINVEYGGEGCEVPTLITPNGDSKNEELVIECIVTGDYPNNSLTIYNQWGDEVFKAAPYNNNWDGTYNGEPLPDGTYFYVFDDGQGGEIDRGALTIFR